MKYKNIEVYLHENQMDIFGHSENRNVKITDKDYDEMFEVFWNAGMRKLNKKKARQLFFKVIKAQQLDPWACTLRLEDDIKQRLIDEKQFGFDRMHPTTYLNGERWEDEHVKEEVPALTASTRDITTEQQLNDRSWAN